MQADYQCPVKPQDDIIIAPQTVQVVGQSGTLTITPAGEVQRNGTPVSLSAGQRQQAQVY